MNSVQVTLLACLPERAGLVSDHRTEILSVPSAARVLGLKRTQVWRYAKDGTLPTVVLGTARRPVYYFRREDVIALKERRTAARANRPRRRKKDQPELRRLLALIRAGEIDLDALPPIRRSV